MHFFLKKSINVKKMKKMEELAFNHWTGVGFMEEVLRVILEDYFY